MANFRKILATLSTVAILSTLVVSTAVSAAGYTDVPTDSWAKSYVDNLVELGVFTGEGKFRPADNMSRAEFVKSVVVAAGLQGTTAITFPDVKDGDWFAPYVKTAVANGVIGGYANGKFGPNDSLTREQAAKIVVKAFDLPEATPAAASFTDVKSTDWSYSYVETLVSYGIVSGYGNGKFGPMDPVKREQVAKIVSLALSPVAPVVVEPGTEVTGGDLGVSLSAATPAAVTLPSNATAAAVLAVDLTAGSNDVTFNGFTVHKKGVGTLPSAFQAYLYDGNNRLTAGKSLNSSTNNIEFSNVGLKVAAGSTTTVVMKIDVGDTGTTTGEVQFELVSDASVKSTADAVAGDFPVVSETIGLSTTDVGTITIAKNGSTTNPKVGQVGAEIAKFKLTATTEAAKLEQLGLYVAGTISAADVTNLKLYVSGTTDPIAEVDGVNSKDLAQFVFATPYEIEKGGTKSFYVTADMAPGRNTDTLSIYVDENTDVVAIGGTYGFGMAVTKTNYMSTTCTASDSSTCSFSTLEGGDITIASSGPSATDVAVNAKDVHLMDFTITSVSDNTFKNFGVGLLGSESADTTEGLLNGTAANFTDIKVINTETGETLMGPVDVTSFTDTGLTGGTAITDADDDAAQAYYLFTDEFSMAAGQTLKLALTTDVANTSSLSGMTLVSSLQLGTTYPQVKDVNNKTLTNSSSLVPASVITGKTMTVKSPSLTMSLASTPAAGSTTKVKGTKDVKFVGMTFACGAASDCKVTDLSLTGYLDASAGNDTYAVAGVSAYVGSVKLLDTAGKEIAPYKSVNSTTGVVAYTNMGWTIKAGESVTVYVVGDLSSNATAGDDVAFALATADNVTVEDTDGNAITTKTGAPNFGASVAGGKTAYVLTSAGGTLTASVDSSTAKNNILVAGSVDQSVSKFKFTTTDESFVVKKLAINNRQSAVAAATNLGDYDNNVVSVKISYVNSLGVAESKTTTLTGGTAEFSGMDMFVDKDDSAVVSVSATLNTISGGATAGELVDLNLAFENFEAVAQGSGGTYKADALDATTVATGAYLSIGTKTWTDPQGLVLDGAEATVTLGSSLEFMVDQGDDTAPLVFLPVGTLVCFNADVVEVGADATEDGTCGSNDNIVVITGRTEGTTEDTYTGLVVDDADAAMATNLAVYYSLPGTGYLTAAKEQVVYESKPAIALDSSSPSGSRSISATDRPFVFTVAETGGKDKLQFRMAEVNPATEAATTFPASELAGAFTGTDELADVASGGVSGGFQQDTNAGGDAMAITYTFTAAADLRAYSGMSAWVMSDETTNTMSIRTVDATANNTAASSTMVANTWQFVDLSFAGVDSNQLDAVTSLSFFVTSGLAVNNKLYSIDEITLYKEKVTISASADADIDTVTSDSADNLVSYLKDGNDTVMTGYWYSSTQTVADASSASITLYPTTADFEISKGTTKTLSLQVDSGSLLNEDAGTDDPVTFSISLGSMSATVGTVSAGGLWWYDTNAQAKWLGDVANTTFSSNTVKY